MTTCNKDTAGNQYVAKRYHYVWQGTALQGVEGNQCIFLYLFQYHSFKQKIH